MKKEYLFLLFVLCVGFTATSKNIALNIKGTIKFNNIPINGAAIKVVQNESSDTLFFSNAKGKFDVILAGDKTYELIISKDGFCPQNIQVNTTTDAYEDGLWKYRCAIELIPTVENNKTICTKPIASIRYNGETDEFENNFTSQAKLEYHELLSEYNEAKDHQYKNIILKADLAYNNGNYPLAKELYLMAIFFNDYDNHPDIQLEMLSRIEMQDARHEARYDNIIKIADVYFAAKEYKKAEKNYIKAYNIKPDDYPKLQLKRLKDIEPRDEDLTAKY